MHAPCHRFPVLERRRAVLDLISGLPQGQAHLPVIMAIRAQALPTPSTRPPDYP
jgi:hypothetical protein